MPQTKVAASLFQKICYQNKDNLMAGIIVAGWDKTNGGSVYSIPLGGSLHKQPFSIGGSGSTYIYGYCDSVFKDNMNKQECIQFTKNGKIIIIKALSLAMNRDGSSGGVIRLAVISKEGVERMFFSGDDIPSKQF